MRMYGERDERIATHPCKRLLMYARAGGYGCASTMDRRSHQVIALAVTGQHDVAATGQVWLAVVTPTDQGISHDPNKCSPPVLLRDGELP